MDHSEPNVTFKPDSNQIQIKSNEAKLPKSKKNKFIFFLKIKLFQKRMFKITKIKHLN